MDTFDRMIGALHGIPGVLSTKPATVRHVSAILGEAQTFIVQTYRQRDEKGDKPVTVDTVFLELANATQHLRIVLPQQVVDAILRQRDSLTTRGRVRAGKARAAAMKAAGIKPGFLRKVNG